MIRVLPSMPAFRYRHTCRRCGCHVVAYFQTGSGFAPNVIKLCSYCGGVYPERSLEARAAGANRVSMYGSENRYSVRGVAYAREATPYRQYHSRYSFGRWTSPSGLDAAGRAYRRP